MSTLWTADEAAKATGGKATGDWSVVGVSIDTRTIEKGDLFVALAAARDGHEFVAAALDKGAGAAMVTHRPEGVGDDAPLLIVDNVQTALEDLGRAGRARMSGKVIAITGSVGKTSTKEMLRDMLSGQGKTHASVDSYNNHWGVPLTLARMPADTDFAVIEIGMNHPGEIAPLARMAAPHVALVTTVAAAHLEAFENIFGIAVEKASIFEGLVPNGVAILNADLETSAILMAKALDCNARTIEFGEHGADFKLKDAQVQDEATVVQATMGMRDVLFKIATPGRHFAMNGLGALAACEAIRADTALSVQGLGRWTPFKGRGVRERVQLDPVERSQTLDLIDDSYNANPTSMAAALEVLAASTPKDDQGRVSKGRRIAFIGDMKELGPEADRLHRDLATLPCMDRIDKVHCIGPLMRNLYDALPDHQRGVWTDTSAEMAQNIRRHLDSGDVVLAKGSLSMKLALIVDAIRKMGHRDAVDEE